MADRTYGVRIHLGPTRRWTLNRVRARAYALSCFSKATQAEHDTAVMCLLTRQMEIPNDEAAQLLVHDLHSARPDDHAATEPLRYTVAIGRARHPRPDAGQLVPVIMITIDGTTVGQITPCELRDHAAGVLATIAAADLDTTFRRVLVSTVGIEDAAAQTLVHLLQGHWPAHGCGAQ
jgi:hypothetical protein